MALTTCSASFSSITSPTWGYEVFVSYYGDDTRTGFTDHLFAALRRSQIRTFRDDTEIERGNDIWTDLEKAIEMSRITVIVFSRDYAASNWCLKELEKNHGMQTEIAANCSACFLRCASVQGAGTGGEFG